MRQSPHAKIGEVGIAEAVWEGGFWGEKMDTCAQSMVPTMWKVLNDPALSHAYANFRIAAGLEEGSHSGPPFFDGDLYKWLEAAAATYAANRDLELDRLMDEVIATIVKAQREDGYIHTPVLIAQKNGKTQEKEANDRLHFEAYNFGHLMTAACRHFEATGKLSLLEAACRAADYLCSYFKDPTPEIAKNNICPSHLMGLVDLYRASGRRTYLELAASLIDMRDLIPDGTDDNQDRIPFRAQRRAVGHAVRANYLFAGAADIYAENGDETLLPSLESLWSNVAATKTYISGSTGALYDGVSPDGDEDHWAIQRVHQAYGREYQLPNAAAYNETCATIGNALWNYRMFKIKGEAAYMEVVETILFNGLLAGISLDGKKFFYKNTLRQHKGLPFSLRWPRTRASYLSSFCCPPNIVRTIAGSSRMAYSLSTGAVWVNLYGGSSLKTKLDDGSFLSLRQITEYPWKGSVSLIVEDAPKGLFEIKMRIPSWAKGAAVSTGAETFEPEPGHYASLIRSWKAGDAIEIELPMRPRLMVANALVEEARNQVALMRGPIVYCLESIDLPEGMEIENAVVPEEADFIQESGSGPLQGMAILKSKILAYPDDAKDSLYAELGRCEARSLEAKFIPYYAWDNRGLSEMSIWLPVRRK